MAVVAAAQVRVDVERSLYSFAGFLSDEERAARRQELERLLNAVVVKHEGKCAGGLQACRRGFSAQDVSCTFPAPLGADC